MKLCKLYMILLLVLFFTYISEKLVNASALDEKSESFISYVADSLELSSLLKLSEPEKQCWPFIIARLEKYGNNDGVANRLVRDLRLKRQVHYSVPGIIRLIYKYPDSPSVRENTQLFIKKAFDRSDSYNVWTGEGDESQISMLRTSAYLFAQKAFVYGDYFENADRRLEEMKSWILDWSSCIYKFGTGDFNSSSNRMSSIIGWLNLYDFAEDNEVKLAAKAVLDYYVAEMSIHSNYGLVGGSEMNGTLINDQLKTDSYFLNWFWFENKNIFFTDRNCSQLIFATTSKYRPPSLFLKYVQSTTETPEFYLNSKASYLFHEKSFNKQMYYRTRNYSLGSLYTQYGGWTKNSSKIVNWKLIVNNSDTISEVRGNGSFWNNYSGLGRDPWTQCGQHENILIQLTKVPEQAKKKYLKIEELCKSWNSKWRKDFKKRFRGDDTKKSFYSSIKDHRFQNQSYLAFPAYVELTDTDGAWFVNFGKTYMAIIGVPTHRPMFQMKQTDKNLLIIDNEPGKVCGFVIELFESKDFADYEDFMASFIRKHIMYLSNDVDLLTYYSPKGNRVEMLYRNEGGFQEPIIDWGFGIDKSAVNLHKTNLKQPDWTSMASCGKVPLLIADGFEYQLDMDWPVFSGSLISLDKSILRIDFKGETYIVDYRNRLPVFSE